VQQARGPVDASVFVSLARHLSDPGRVRGTGMQCLVADRPLIFIRLETLGGGVTFPSFSVSRSCAILFRMYPFRRMWRLSSRGVFRAAASGSSLRASPFPARCARGRGCSCEEQERPRAAGSVSARRDVATARIAAPRRAVTRAKCPTLLSPTRPRRTQWGLRGKPRSHGCESLRVRPGH